MCIPLTDELTAGCFRHGRHILRAEVREQGLREDEGHAGGDETGRDAYKGLRFVRDVPLQYLVQRMC